jgi:hypothetical protein
VVYLLEYSVRGPKWKLQKLLALLMSVSDPNHVTCLQHLEAFIKARIPSIQAMINKQIDELESELNQIGRPLANDAGVLFSSLILYSSW